MADWNAELYSKFEKERTLPCYDLVRAVETVPETVLDVGCGIGNSTQVLADTFPAAHIIGADNSPDMLRYARENHPGLEFIELDAAHDLEKLPEKYDLVFSNACLQWLPDHRTRIRELMGLLNEGGTLAVQIPSQAKHPVHHLLTETAHGARWQGKITSFRQYNELTEEEYFDALSENASAFRMWEIMYFFEMPSHESILEWYRGTGLRPYLAQLCDEDKTAFEAEILDGIRKLYPVQKNGSIIFRFPRLFFAARK